MPSHRITIAACVSDASEQVPGHAAARRTLQQIAQHAFGLVKPSS